ncbi:MAG TPA: DUF4160 domain-containing protein [Saprospiraceae bacterium]|nr:DUF4160 domain-containing protein [Saprospiraceae bacterium]HMQ81388.1 DUF4160 domain-containing protein [Saprospiraceae bacterium]
MLTYFTFDGIKVDLYFDDHPPPHFHALYAEYEAIITIQSLEVYRGYLPKKQLKTVLKWSKEYQNILAEIWENNHK